MRRVLASASRVGRGTRHSATLRDRSAVGRECDLDGQSAAGPWLRGDDGGVGSGDRADDGQAKTVTAVGSGRARAEALKWLEQAVYLGGRNDLPRAAHRQERA